MEEIQVDEKIAKLTNPMENMRDPRKPFHILSIIAWMVLITSMWPFYRDRNCFWSKIEYSVYIHGNATSVHYFPLQMKTEWLSSFIFIITIVGFVVFLIFTTCSRNNELFNGMFEKHTIFHFIPFLLISAIFFITENFDLLEDIEINNDDHYYPYYKLKIENGNEIKDRFKLNRTLLIFDLIFTILGLISLLVFYCRLELKCPWYMAMAIKNGIFSTFIVLLWYNFFHIIICLRSVVFLIDVVDGKKKLKDLKSFYKGTGIAFCILIGVVVITFSLCHRDIVMQFVNFLMYVGLVMAYYNRPKFERKTIKEDFNKGVDGIFNIVIMSASLICIPITIIYSRNLFT